MNENGCSCNKLFSTTIDVDLAWRSLAQGLEMPLSNFQLFPPQGAREPFYRLYGNLDPSLPLSTWVKRLMWSWELYEVAFNMLGDERLRITMSPGPGLCVDLFYYFPQTDQGASDKATLVKQAHFVATNWEMVENFFSPKEVVY